MTKRLLRRIELSSLDYYTHHISPKTIPPKMTKLFSKLKLTKLFYIFPQQDQETIIRPEIFHNHTPKNLFAAQCSSLQGIDWREGISQIVKCVGVETPHCGDVEMWWIHIVKMWRCGGSTFKVRWSTYNSYLSKNERKSPLF